MYRSASYATRRASMRENNHRNQSSGWGRNQNTVNFSSSYGKRLGTISHIVIILMIVLTLGFLYLSQTIKVTGYDHDLAEVNEEVATLEAERDALAVENAKLAAQAMTDSNSVAASMASADEVIFASE